MMAAVSNHDRVEELIGQTADPTQRAMLMLFVKLGHEIDANTDATRRIAVALEAHKDDFSKHTVRFDQHVLDEKSMLASAKGAWWASTLLIGCVMALGIYIVKGFSDSLLATTSLVQDVVQRVRVLESTVNREHNR